MSDTTVLILHPTRAFETEEEVIKAWIDGKDFKMGSSTGMYCSICNTVSLQALADVVVLQFSPRRFIHIDNLIKLK